MSGEEELLAPEQNANRHLVLAILIDETAPAWPAMRQIILWLAREGHSFGLIGREIGEANYESSSILDLLMEIHAAGGIGLNVPWKPKAQEDAASVLMDLIDAFGRIDGILLMGNSAMIPLQDRKLRHIPIIACEFETLGSEGSLKNEAIIQRPVKDQDVWQLALPVLPEMPDSIDTSEAFRQKVIDAIAMVCAAKK